MAYIVYNRDSEFRIRENGKSVFVPLKQTDEVCIFPDGYTYTFPVENECEVSCGGRLKFWSAVTPTDYKDGTTVSVVSEWVILEYSDIKELTINKEALTALVKRFYPRLKELDF
jgi:hypothetical protein